MALGEHLDQELGQGGRECDLASLAALRRRHLAADPRAAHVQAPALEVDVLPAESEELTPPETRPEEQRERRREAGLVLARELEEPRHLDARPGPRPSSPRVLPHARPGA